jgi:hypothetical protein
MRMSVLKPQNGYGDPEPESLARGDQQVVQELVQEGSETILVVEDEE